MKDRHEFDADIGHFVITNEIAGPWIEAPANRPLDEGFEPELAAEIFKLSKQISALEEEVRDLGYHIQDLNEGDRHEP